MATIELWLGTTEKLNMTIYVGESPTDADGDVDVTVTQNGEAIDSATATKTGTGVYEYIPTLAMTQSPGEYKVTWDYTITPDVTPQTGQRIDWILVVVPYLTLDQLQSISELADADFDDLKEMERRVRLTIDAFCGQSFGYFDATLFTRGGYPRVSYPILSLEEVLDGEDDVTDEVDIDVVDDQLLTGWTFADDISVTGRFGFEHVPNGVNVAAKLIATAFACDQNLYRDRNVRMVATNSTKTEFNVGNDRTWLQTTGSIEADHILADHTAFGVEVI